MASGNASPPNATPASRPLKRSTSSSQNMKNQKSILGFFQKSSPSTPLGKQNTEPASSPAQRASERRVEGHTNGSSKASQSTVRSSQDLMPMPSSDLVDADEDEPLNKVSDIELESVKTIWKYLLTDYSNPGLWWLTKGEY